MVARIYGGVDLTRVGSRRTGATNVLRTLGPGAAAIVFLVDFLKGGVAVLLAALIWPGELWPMALAGGASVFGHAFSPFLGFKGGRGVTTGLGSLLALAPGAALPAIIVGVAAIGLSRYVSLGSILGTAVGGLVLCGWALATAQSLAYVAFGLVVCTFIIAAHHDNIGRLLHGTERKLGQRVEQSGGG